MYRQLVAFIALTIWSATILALPKQANAETALTRAVVQSIRNLVQLIPQDRTVRSARVADTIAPGDALSTGRASLAELRFNDGSLARIGEQAVFRFVTKTRNFKLSNGTALLLIPPGRGTTGVWTPNAAAAIRGSALFVRYIPETATTVVGALTNSKIEVFNQGASGRQVLQAGQMAVVVKDRIAGLYNFDLKTFYETSDLVRGLDLNKKSGAASSDKAIASVQAETTAALAAQSPLTESKVIVNPAFIRRPDNGGQVQPTLTLQEDSQNPFSNTADSITNLRENGEVSNRENPQSLSNDAPVLDMSPNSNAGNNGIGDGVGGGQINNPATGNSNAGNNGIGDGVGGGQINNPATGNSNAGNNGIGDGVGGGQINNPATGNGNAGNNGIGDGVGGGQINNPATGNGNAGNNGIGDGVGGGQINNPATGNGNAGNNGIGDGVGGGQINNTSNGNGNGNAGNNGIGDGVGGGRINNTSNGNGNGNAGNNGIGDGVGGGRINNTSNGNGNGNGDGKANNTGNNNPR